MSGGGFLDYGDRESEVSRGPSCTSMRNSAAFSGTAPARRGVYQRQAQGEGRVQAAVTGVAAGIESRERCRRNRHRFGDGPNRPPDLGPLSPPGAA
jgi:hypothetical protein